MSAAKRKIKRQIARIIRMDDDYHFCQFRWGRSDHQRQATAARILASMQALGKAMTRRGLKDRGYAAIELNRQLRGRK